ncbi:Carboxylesterase family protein [Taphrina deformans PYCC 5710]|uniref:Carboxylesterase family protein n=1 Tax=Taphrina deformans (strain PYCC 5710 / ATCC 11124 / CBS 356.35 / IMI 108563 / JCM 9778 / NBRC 8474) TaxID=1097556 RepID=R4XG00_TAPDE|nr:Carboxylesterase family protein [Taphrina deformans PYCC 5710]|eukprot:CCG82309.1 Carboxylesterase family protein [Taphrina deformans PYCC 5710]
MPSYVYEYKGFYSNIDKFPALDTYHSCELSMAIATYNKSTIAPVISSQIATPSQRQGAWTAFAQDLVHGQRKYGLIRGYARNGSSLNVSRANNSAFLTYEGIRANATACGSFFPEIV